MTKRKIMKDIATVFPEFSNAHLSSVIDAFFSVLREELCKKNRIEIRGFGVFKVTELRKRKIHNPILKKVIVANAKYRVRFKESSVFYGDKSYLAETEKKIVKDTEILKEKELESA